MYVMLGYAPYWGSPFWGLYYGYINGSVTANAPMLQATLDYANGNVSTAFSELVKQFTGYVTKSDGSPAGIVLGTGNNVNDNEHFQAIFKNFEAMAAQHDGQRQSGYNKLAIMHYEGGPQWGSGINLPNGVNSVNPTDIAACAGQLVSLGWNLSSFTQTGSPKVAFGTYNSGTGVVTLVLNTAVMNGAAAQITAQLYVQNNFPILEVSAISTGTMHVGQTLSGSGVTTCTITQFFDNLGVGGNARWVVSAGQTVSSQTMHTGDTVTVSGLTGTGSIASINGTFVTVPTTSGTTLSYLAASGLALTIDHNSGSVYNSTAAAIEVATNIMAVGQAWKVDVSYKNMIKTSYYQMLAIHQRYQPRGTSGQYGYADDALGVFPSSYSLDNPYQNYYAIKEWNA